MKVLLDAGHGIDTPGKRSPDGKFREYLWNRQVADLTEQILRNSGVDVSQVVRETNDIPLKTRVNRINNLCKEMGAANVLVVSIHSNAAGNGKDWYNATGWSCYTSVGHTKSDLLADCLYGTFMAQFPEKRMRTDKSDGDLDIESDFYILKNTKCPAVLTENFFYDNKEECQWLLLEETKRRIARATADGIINYLCR